MVLLRRVLLAALALVVVLLVVRVQATSRVAQQLKTDLAEIDDLRYGLLDVDVWVDHLAVVLDRQIQSFGSEPAQREEVQAVFEEVIHELITEAERTIRLQNDERPFGALRQLATEFVVDFDDLRDRSGEFAAAAVAELERPENRDRVRTFLADRVSAYADSTFDRTDRTAYDAVFTRHGCEDRAGCRAQLTGELAQLNGSLLRDAWIAIGAVAVMLLFAARPTRPLAGWELGALLVGVFALLAGGLFTPMIDIEAEITRLEMVLVGEPITFENQVLFFQSKSIVDVIDLLLRTGRIDLVLVGVGIGLFSVVFPILKLLSTIAYRYRPRLRDHRSIRFFALESGKWSMADVFVIAMFLAFLGFDGLTGNQLAALVSDSPDLGVATENGTELRAGFHLFAAFCLAGLVLSGLVKRSVAPEGEDRRGPLPEGDGP